MQRATPCGFSASRLARLQLITFVLAVVNLSTPGRASGADTTASVLIHAQVSSRTSLKVSTESLRFEVLRPFEDAVAVVEFSAAVRTHAGANVVLSIEVGAEPGGRSHDEPASTLTFVGEGEGALLEGTVARTSPFVAARWIGSGRRIGRLKFLLRARTPGSYTVPLRFVLTAP